MDHKLQLIYENPNDPGSYGGIDRLLKSALSQGIKVSRNQVVQFLKTHEGYTLHRPARKRFLRNPTIVSGIDKQWQADLVDISNISNYNEGTKYLLTVIDCFSKYAWAIPIKTKSANDIIYAFKIIFKKRKPNKLQTDKGKEFLNKDFQKYLKQNNVFHFVTENETKAAMVERFNRTLKTRMWTFFTTKNTRKFLDILPEILTSYNNSIHRTTGMRPSEITKKDELKLFHRMYGRILASSSFPRKRRNTGTLEKNIPVRISKTKTTFEKGYLPNWTGEVFRITSSTKRPSKRVYKLRDELGEDIAGTFYPEEIQHIFHDPKKLRPIEKIIKTRTVRGKKEHLVQWLHLPAKFNSWVKDKDLKKIDQK